MFGLPPELTWRASAPPILPELRNIDTELTPQDRLGAAVEANLRWSLH
jgi:hypothetical protein